MPEHYESEPASETAPAPASKPKRESKKLTDKQKTDLNKHMAKMKKDGMSLSEQKSHRMKLMSRMRNKNMSVNKAHADIMGK